MRDPDLVAGRPVYRYYLAWTVSGDLALELTLQGVSFSRQIRRAGSFSGTVTIQDDDQLREAYSGTMPGRMSLYVTRDGTPVWGGFVSRRTYESSTRTIQLEATGFESYLYRRFIWHDTYQSGETDQYQVVRNLVALMQTDFAESGSEQQDGATPRPDNGNIGLTVDSRNSGRTQDAQTWPGGEMQNFGDAIEGFSDNIGGFEYTIQVGWDRTANKFTKRLVFRDTPPSQFADGEEYEGERPGLDENFFEQPGNVMSLGYDDTIDDCGTRQWVTGESPGGEGEASLPPARGAWENEAYLATNWPLFEVVESGEHSTVSNRETLERYAKSYGRRARPPVPAWSLAVNGSMNPQVGDYEPGDWCRFVVTDPFLSQGIESTGNLTKVLTRRIAAFTVTVPDTEQQPETVQLTLIDEWDNDGGA